MSLKSVLILFLYFASTTDCVPRSSIRQNLCTNCFIILFYFAENVIICEICETIMTTIDQSIVDPTNEQVKNCMNFYSKWNFKQFLRILLTGWLRFVAMSDPQLSQCAWSLSTSTRTTLSTSWWTTILTQTRFAKLLGLARRWMIWIDKRESWANTTKQNKILVY